MKNFTEKELITFLKTYTLERDATAEQKFIEGALSIYVREDNLTIHFSTKLDGRKTREVSLLVTPNWEDSNRIVPFLNWREGHETALGEHSSLDNFLKILTSFNKAIPEVTPFFIKRGNALVKALETRLEIEEEQRESNARIRREARKREEARESPSKEAIEWNTTASDYHFYKAITDHILEVRNSPTGWSGVIIVLDDSIEENKVIEVCNWKKTVGEAMKEVEKAYRILEDE